MQRAQHAHISAQHATGAAHHRMRAQPSSTQRRSTPQMARTALEHAICAGCSVMRTQTLKPQHTQHTKMTHKKPLNAYLRLPTTAGAMPGARG